jgi:hypothetical protein
MTNRILKLIALALLVVSVILGTVIVTAQDDPEIQAKIDNAMSAAPLFIAQDATILDWAFDADGNFVVLRAGTNGWTCLPDNPGTPSNDPMCLDEVFMEWLYALIAGDEPNVTVPGFAYLLQGGETFSNRDPSAVEPAADHWMSSSPYMMILLPASVDISGFSTDEHSDNPFVMYAGTPYQHLMVLVADTAVMPDMDQ